MTRRTVAWILAAEALVIAALLTAALDQYVHSQTELIDGLNTWGYRGAVAKQRVFDETRIVMAGGTHAFDPGRAVKDTVSFRVRYIVEQWVTFDRGPVTNMNLGVVNLPRGAYAARLEAYRYLGPDVICLYVDLAPAAAPVPSPGLITRATGYVPAWRPLVAIDRLLGSVLTPLPSASDDIRAVADAVDVAVSIAPTVVAVSDPASDTEKAEREVLRAALAKFSGHPRVAVVEVKDGPDVELSGVMHPAAAAQIEPAVSVFLRARSKQS